MHATGRHIGQFMINAVRERPIYRPNEITSCAHMRAYHYAYVHCAMRVYKIIRVVGVSALCNYRAQCEAYMYVEELYFSFILLKLQERLAALNKAKLSDNFREHRSLCGKPIWRYVHIYICTFHTYNMYILSISLVYWQREDMQAVLVW